MTFARLISSTLRSGLLISVGTALMMLPVVLGMAPSVVVTGIAIGGLQVALGIAGTAAEGRGTLPVSAQAVYDRGLALGLLAIAILYGVIGNEAAVLPFGGAGLVSLTVAMATRYSVRRI